MIFQKENKIMKGIIYTEDGKRIEIVEDNNSYSLPKDFLTLKDDILNIVFYDSFGYNFTEFYNKQGLIDKIFEYEKKFGVVKKIILHFNEVIVDPTQIYKLENEIFRKFYYTSYDMEPPKDGKKLFLPLSLLSQLDYALNSGYYEAKKFLLSMTSNYYDLIKPHKSVFLSNHVSPIRIEIFKILKNTDNLKNCAWAFQNKLVYYSGEKHDLDLFFTENKGLIPYSYDGFDDKKNVLKSTYFYQFESYFEISTDSYFFKDIKNINNSCPITEKVVKPILSFIPFIMFGSPRLKYNLENIGLTFNCPLYGFYDNTSEESITQGLKHVESMITKSRQELHKIYFEFFNEFTKNNEVFLKHFSDLRRSYKNNILNTTII